ncbi:MAG: hypothetical protein K0M70_06740 [Arenimonas sp.]|uniref:hypothetical protein n=1 Tax=Arenimonas sp. TaxID=1872635 RepID=UPI0025C38BE7|nr:hypothetical protein [Arenimonas sp.]MBW8367539.1 hypothetical protein [Arenimonas sp.]
MSPRRPDDPRTQQRRLLVAQEAARLLDAGEQVDNDQARRKAASRLGVFGDAGLPDAALIREALGERQRLFGRAQAPALGVLREAALQAMAFLASFDPRLVGPVLEGTAGDRSGVQLHLHPQDPDDVARFLHDQRIPVQPGTRRVRLERDRSADLPCWHFTADGVDFELVVLPSSALRQAPLEPLEAAPMPRASAAAVRRLVGASGD